MKTNGIQLELPLEMKECPKPKKTRPQRVVCEEVELAKMVLMPGIKEVIRLRSLEEVKIDVTIVREFSSLGFEGRELKAIRKAAIWGHRNYDKYEDTLVLKYTDEEKQKQASGIEEFPVENQSHQGGWTVGDCFWMFELPGYLK